MNEINLSNEERSVSNNGQLKKSTAPLYDAIQVAPLDAENFDIYKNKLLNILSTFDEQLPLILGNCILLQPWQINEENLDTIFHGLLLLSQSFREYSRLFLSPGTSKGYRILGDICHDLTPQAENLKKLFFYTKGNKDQNIQYFTGLMGRIKEYKEKIGSLSFFAEEMFRVNTFSPAKHVNGIFNQFPLLQEKGISKENTILEKDISSYGEIFDVVIHNLIANAAKFTPEKGIISVGMDETHPECFSFFVQDSGVGISDDVDVFAQGYTTVSPSGQVGTGLGLPACKNFLKDIGGNIWHEKGPDGIGTKFIFTLPIKKD